MAAFPLKSTPASGRRTDSRNWTCPAQRHPCGASVDREVGKCRGHYGGVAARADQLSKDESPVRPFALGVDACPRESGSHPQGPRRQDDVLSTKPDPADPTTLRRTETRRGLPSAVLPAAADDRS